MFLCEALLLSDEHKEKGQVYHLKNEISEEATFLKTNELHVSDLHCFE